MRPALPVFWTAAPLIPGLYRPPMGPRHLLRPPIKSLPVDSKSMVPPANHRTVCHPPDLYVLTYHRDHYHPATSVHAHRTFRPSSPVHGSSSSSPVPAWSLRMPQLHPGRRSVGQLGAMGSPTPRPSPVHPSPDAAVLPRAFGPPVSRLKMV